MEGRPGSKTGWVSRQARHQASKPPPPLPVLPKDTQSHWERGTDGTHPTHAPTQTSPAQSPHSGTTEIHTPTPLCGSNCFILKYTGPIPKRVGMGEKEMMKAG